MKVAAYHPSTGKTLAEFDVLELVCRTIAQRGAYPPNIFPGDTVVLKAIDEHGDFPDMVDVAELPTPINNAAPASS